ncbi:phosphotransferase family protein [Sphingomonas sp. TREG-RG-20F-R18-01]|uniref:phosphotransferase family protein n=1 Tax=Sphingomonas sp. TREG-RG-20F-R18-01 TaxID=2914982 RepID=UPI001F584A90|nr:phosphotransferase family protein [Sphingomonas sp. TREG-RG-20F-R18-01]
MIAGAVDLDEIVLLRWLEANAEGFAGPIDVSKFPGGQSNPTYRIDAASGAYVVRRKPVGTLLRSAHAVDREYRLISALHPTGFPVPRPFALCEDTAVIGSIFYVMEMVAGRTFWNAALPEAAPAERRPIYEAMLNTLAKLHAIDPVAIGLGDFGRPGNYFARQIDRWTKQYRAAQTDDIPAIERLIEWLPRTVPAQGRTSIIHGDYRIDNLIYAPDGPQVAAVLDWELATIGDPLADFAYFAMNWAMPADGGPGLSGLDLASLDLPTMEETVELYCADTGRTGLPDLHWYFAYNQFRLVSIIQGIKKRLLEGNASSAKAEATATRLIPITESAWRHARLAGAR